jgi:hypothetical protein
MPIVIMEYICKLCFQEILNTYTHCFGCEIGCKKLLDKAFNICVTCHSENKHHQFVIMSAGTEEAPDSNSGKPLNCSTDNNMALIRYFDHTIMQSINWHAQFWQAIELFHQQYDTHPLLFWRGSGALVPFGKF